MNKTIDELPKDFSYGILCKSDEVGSFVTWFKTKDLDKAKRLASCITNNPNCLFKSEK